MTQNAQNAVRDIVTLSAPSPKHYFRAGPKLGLFATLYIAENGYLPVFSAMQGIAVQMKLHAADSATDNSTYALLQEFGSVLSVNIPDLLNRSNDRSRTLNEYMTSLANITARAKEKQTEVENDISRFETERRSAQADGTAIQRTVNAALKDRDYATAASEQEKLSAAQSRQAQAETSLKLSQNIRQTLLQLSDLSQRRQNAIDQNREVLIAGLGVVQVPGIEDLNILKQGKKTGGSPGGGFFSL